jgi:hyperosmotically inducible periplasmic protein
MKISSVSGILCTVSLVATLLFAAACGTSQSPRSQVDDTAITAQVKTKLASDIGVTSVTDIEVNTTNGVVTLAGQVENEGVRDRAEQITASVEGVVSVNNHLQVESAAAR